MGRRKDPGKEESEELPTKYRWPKEREVVELSLESCKDTNGISDIIFGSTDFLYMTTVSTDITDVTTVSSDILEILSETGVEAQEDFDICNATSSHRYTLVMLLFSNVNH